MTSRLVLSLSAVLAAVAAAGFAWFVRLPLPFDGFAVLAAAGLAFVGTLALVSWAPSDWLWSDTERLRYAFQARHGVSADGADAALLAVTQAHDHARTLRGSAAAMRDDMAEKVGVLADRLDAAAREIFYAPRQQRDLRAVLIRADLIVDAANAHAKLRARREETTETASRAKLNQAIDTLNSAFDDTNLMAARGLLEDVEVASDVAERVLAPRRPLT